MAALSTAWHTKMDFKKATDELMSGLTRGQIAEALGKSEALIRQARLSADNAAVRTPPQGWEGCLAAVAEKEGYRLLRLAKALNKAAAAQK